MALSDAVALDRVSRVLGYKITPGNFKKTTDNLPQRIAILAEGNTDNQATMPTIATEITSEKEAGTKFGFGSPIHMIARILLPKTGGGVTCPVVVYPQAEVAGATFKTVTVTPTGTATGNGTIFLKIAGRYSVDGQSYAVNIVTGDTPATISQKMADVVTSVTSSPVFAAITSSHVDFSTKWKGATAADLNVFVDLNNTSLGVTYAVTTGTTASGAQSANIFSSLNSFGSTWNTIVINSYGTASNILKTYEDYNGVPDATTPTGRFTSDVVKPFVAITGTLADDPSTITDSRLNEVTIAIAPAPLSPAFAFEAAANMAVLYANVASNTPELDVAGQSYPDMPANNAIGTMSIFSERDRIVKKGCSTVDLVAGKFVVQDFVTTYHKVGENPPQFRYVRNLYCIDMNVYYSVYLKEQQYVIDHVIANDTDTINSTKFVKPKMWKQVLVSLADDLVRRGIIVDKSFFESNLQVGISATNPDRFETAFKYKRSGIARIVSTTAEAGFNFGTV